MPRNTSIRTPLRPEHKKYVEYLRLVLEDAEDVDPDALRDALAALSEEALSEEAFEDAMFHLSREYRNRGR